MIMPTSKQGLMNEIERLWKVVLADEDAEIDAEHDVANCFSDYFIKSHRLNPVDTHVNNIKDGIITIMDYSPDGSSDNEPFDVKLTEFSVKTLSEMVKELSKYDKPRACTTN